MMIVNLSAARSLAKRWLERQVGFVRTTENGSLNFHIVVAFTFHIPVKVVVYIVLVTTQEATWHSEVDLCTQQHCLDLPQPLPLTGTRQPVQEHQGPRLNVGGKSLSEGRPRSGLSGS